MRISAREFVDFVLASGTGKSAVVRHIGQNIPIHSTRKQTIGFHSGSRSSVTFAKARRTQNYLKPRWRTQPTTVPTATAGRSTELSGSAGADRWIGPIRRG